MTIVIFILIKIFIVMIICFNYFTSINISSFKYTVLKLFIFKNEIR